MWWEGKLQFLTHVAQPYPPALGIQYGALMAEAVRLRAVAIESGVRVPMAAAELADVPSLSLQQAAWLSPCEGGSVAVAGSAALGHRAPHQRAKGARHATASGAGH